MKIKFSYHAKLRCAQRRIPEQWVSFHLQRIPLSPGTHEHLIEGTNLTVVFHDGIVNRTVITLYPVVKEERQQWQIKKKVDLEPIKDMLNKEMEKHYRRKKKMKRLKPKRR